MATPRSSTRGRGGGFVRAGDGAESSPHNRPPGGAKKERHGGKRGAFSKDRAHTDLVPYPSEDAQTYCSGCHATEVATYATGLHYTQEGYYKRIEQRAGFDIRDGGHEGECVGDADRHRVLQHPRALGELEASRNRVTEGRKIMDSKLQDLVQEQIGHEYYSSYLYLQMASYFESENLDGFAQWMKVQTREEREHGDKMFEFLQDRGVRVILRALPQPPSGFASPVDVFDPFYAPDDSSLDVDDLIPPEAIDDSPPVVYDDAEKSAPGAIIGRWPLALDRSPRARRSPIDRVSDHVYDERPAWAYCAVENTGLRHWQGDFKIVDDARSRQIHLHLSHDTARAGGEHHHPIRDIHHGLHYVFDHQDGHALFADLQNGLHHAVNFGGIESREHFIEQEQIGTRRQRPSHFQPLLLRDVQTAGQLISSGCQPDKFQHFVCDLRGIAEMLILVPEARANHDVLPNRKFIQGLDDLVRACHPQSCMIVRFNVGHILVTKNDTSLIGRIDPIDCVEQGGFSRAVGTDQAEDLSLRQVEGHVGKCQQATKCFAYTLYG